MTTLQVPVRRGRLLLTVTALALCTTPAAAEQTDEDHFQMLGRIILGTGTARVATDTPQAVPAPD